MNKNVKEFILITSIVLLVNYGGGFALSKLVNLDYNTCIAIVSIINLGLIIFTSYISKLVNFVLK